MKCEIEMAIISIYKKVIGSYETRNTAVDMIDANEDLINAEKIKKWSVVKKWNDDRNVNDWIKYNNDDVRTPKKILSVRFDRNLTGFEPVP